LFEVHVVNQASGQMPKSWVVDIEHSVRAVGFSKLGIQTQNLSIAYPLFASNNFCRNFNANHAVFDPARDERLNLETIQTRVFALCEGQTILFLDLKSRHQPAERNSSANSSWFLLRLEVLA
jgi:hypothetical protein